MIEDTGSVDGLESQVLVVEMTDKQTLGGEGVRLDIDVGSRDASQEARLSDVRETADDQCARVGVDGRQTTKMLSNLVQVEERVLQSLDNGGHATQRGPLELLALEERLSVLEKSDVISGNGLDQMFRSRKLTQGDPEMVGIVEGVEQILVEGVDVLQAREAVEDGAKLLGEGLLGELDFSGVEAYESVSANRSCWRERAPYLGYG